MPIEYRPITEDDLAAATRTQSWAFGSRFDESWMHTARDWFELGDYVGAFDGSDPVGVTELFPFDITVPGGSVPAACIGGVAVLPSHRRRGLLTEMMKCQLTAAYERGLPVSPLGASEAPIYGRFGYGKASEGEGWKVDRHRAVFRQDYTRDGSIKMIETERARELFPEVYRRTGKGRAGIIQPPKPWWDHEFDDARRRKKDQPANFYVEYREDDVQGCAYYRIKDGTLSVWMLLACTDAAYAALLRYCLDVDLIKTIQVWSRPVDDPLIWMLHDPRALKRRIFDWVWLRLVDVPKALSSRTYAIDGEIVFKVHDTFCPWNDATYHLTGSPSGATCKRTTKSPDITLSVDDLAVPYLGGFPFTPLAHAGRVEEHTPNALHRADAMFATQLKPWSPMLT